jgi:hypothetical protein
MRKLDSHQHKNPLSPHQIKAGGYLRVELSQAHEILSMVRNITENAVIELEPLKQRLNNMVPADPRNARIHLEYERVVKHWAGKIERLGLKVLGLWRVGFDGGEGWFGWQYPERSIRYFLEYDGLFSERCLLCKLDKKRVYARTSRK